MSRDATIWTNPIGCNPIDNSRSSNRITSEIDYIKYITDNWNSFKSKNNINNISCDEFIKYIQEGSIEVTAEDQFQNYVFVTTSNSWIEKSNVFKCKGNPYVISVNAENLLTEKAIKLSFKVKNGNNRFQKNEYNYRVRSEERRVGKEC